MHTAASELLVILQMAAVSRFADPSAPCATGEDGPAPGAFNASSHHPGGVNMLLCDGSVKFVKNSVAMPTWWALGTMAGGEVVSADAY